VLVWEVYRVANWAQTRQMRRGGSSAEAWAGMALGMQEVRGQ